MPGAPNFDQLFADFFAKRPSQGRDLRLDLPLSGIEAAMGCRREIAVSRRHLCDTCAGTGGDRRPCAACHATGQVKLESGPYIIDHACRDCGGAGSVIARRCPACDSGTIAREERLTVEIPAGSQPGQLLRLAGKGDDARDLPTGDLYLALQVAESLPPAELSPAHPFRNPPRESPRVGPNALTRSTSAGFVLVAVVLLLGFFVTMLITMCRG